MDTLFVWYSDGATEAEKLVWESFKSSESMQDAEFLEVENRDEIEKELERLAKEGWKFQSVGSGSLSRLSAYVKSET